MSRLSSPRTSLLLLASLLLALALLASPVAASSGDRNPTFQHCLKGCTVSNCQGGDITQLPFYLQILGWTCAEDCAYHCSHSFTDNIRPGSKFHQFYGKWAFYRFFGIQEPFSVLMSIGNLWVHYRGLRELSRRVRSENKLRNWLVAFAVVQINTWVWSAVFHSRDTPTTERLDYFSATVTIAYSLLYAFLRVFLLQTPTARSRLAVPTAAIVGLLVVGHFTYVLSFPRHSFPYGYHNAFNIVLGLVHNFIWAGWSISFITRLPSTRIAGYEIGFPAPYPPRDPLTVRPRHALQPLILVILTCCAMGLELLDFSPFFRLVDAHAMWHAATIPLGSAWWSFLIEDAIELEGSLLGAPSSTSSVSGFGGITSLLNPSSANSGGFPLTGGSEKQATPSTPTLSSFAQVASSTTPVKSNSMRRSPSRDGKGDRKD